MPKSHQNSTKGPPKRKEETNGERVWRGSGVPTKILGVPWGVHQRARLVVIALEVGGRWSMETRSFLSQLAKVKACGEPHHMRQRTASVEVLVGINAVVCSRKSSGHLIARVAGGTQRGWRNPNRRCRGTGIQVCRADWVSSAGGSARTPLCSHHIECSSKIHTSQKIKSGRDSFDPIVRLCQCRESHSHQKRTQPLQGPSLVRERSMFRTTTQLCHSHPAEFSNARTCTRQGQAKNRVERS